jgi:hypothetical protein
MPDQFALLERYLVKGVTGHSDTTEWYVVALWVPGACAEAMVERVGGASVDCARRHFINPPVTNPHVFTNPKATHPSIQRRSDLGDFADEH